MDTLAHGLWGGMLFGWRRRFGLAFLFGLCPDLFSFGLWIVIRMARGQWQHGRPDAYMLPEWLHTAYNFTHSLIIIGAVWALLWWCWKELALPFSAWPLHILCDIPTHSQDFFPTPFLYPLSSFTIDGISWGRWWFMLLNYTGLLILALFWVRAREGRRNKASYSIEVATGSGSTQAEQASSSSSKSA